MDKVFIYWDNSNIFVEAQRFAEERNSGPDARYRVRIDFTNMLRRPTPTARSRRLTRPAPCRPRCVSCGTGWRVRG